MPTIWTVAKLAEEISNLIQAQICSFEEKTMVDDGGDTCESEKNDKDVE